MFHVCSDLIVCGVEICVVVCVVVMFFVSMCCVVVMFLGLCLVLSCGVAGV